MLILLILVGISSQAKVYNLPIQTNITDIGCSYNELFELVFQPNLVGCIGTYNDNGKYYEITGLKFFKNQLLNKVKIAKYDLTVDQYSIQSLRLYYPAKNIIQVAQDQTVLPNPQRELELQLILEQTKSDSKDFENKRQYARISIFFADGQTDQKNHLPDGVPMLLPFTQINQGQLDEQQNIEVNFVRMFDSIHNDFHQFIGFQGKFDNDKQIYNTYFNKKKFYVPPDFLEAYFFQSGTAAVRNSATKEDIEANSVKICYGGAEETLLRQNYALWLWVIVLLVWWITMVCTENDTDQVFMDEYLDNKLTMIPLYSMYVVSNDVFFSKLSRQSSYLLYFSWEILIISILFGQFYEQNTYNVEDAIILWYAIIAIVLAWPIGYFFGIMQYYFRELNKHKMLLETDYKKITNKHSMEGVNLSKAIRDDEDRQYTYWFTYYAITFLFFWGNCLISIWQMILVDRETSDYWVATIFVIIFIDQIVLDTILPFIPGMKSILKYRGYYYDGELAKVWKHMEEI